MTVASESHSPRYFALLYASPAERAVLDALFGIEREVFESVRPGLDHHVAHSRLQWWREECERAARGGAVHPLTQALIAALGEPNAKSVPQLSGLCGIVDVAIWDLASATFETRRELEAYCQRWAAAMVEPLVALTTPAEGAATGTASNAAGSRASQDSQSRPAALGSSTLPAITDSHGAVPSAASTQTAASAALPESAERTAAWHSLGADIREIEMLSDLAREAHHGRLRLPLDELEIAKSDTATLAKPPWAEPVTSLIRARLASLRNDIERNVTGLDRAHQHTLRGLLVWAALSWRTAQRVEQALPNRLQPGRFDAIRDTWFAWRVARRATVGRFRLS